MVLTKVHPGETRRKEVKCLRVDRCKLMVLGHWLIIHKTLSGLSLLVFVLYKHDHFKDSAQVEYDCAVRQLAETEGFCAFSQENNGLSVVYYGTQNMRQKTSKTSYSTGITKRPFEYVKDGKKPCFKCFKWLQSVRR